MEPIPSSQLGPDWVKQDDDHDDDDDYGVDDDVNDDQDHNDDEPGGKMIFSLPIRIWRSQARAVRLVVAEEDGGGDYMNIWLCDNMANSEYDQNLVEPLHTHNLHLVEISALYI